MLAKEERNRFSKLECDVRSINNPEKHKGILELISVEAVMNTRIVSGEIVEVVEAEKCFTISL